MVCHHDTKKTEIKSEIELKGFNRYCMRQHTPKTLIDITIITMTLTPIHNLIVWNDNGLNIRVVPSTMRVLIRNIKHIHVRLLIQL